MRKAAFDYIDLHKVYNLNYVRNPSVNKYESFKIEELIERLKISVYGRVFLIHIPFKGLVKNGNVDQKTRLILICVSNIYKPKAKIRM